MYVALLGNMTNKFGHSKDVTSCICANKQPIYILPERGGVADSHKLL